MSEVDLRMVVGLVALAGMCVLIKLAAVRLRQQRLLSVAANLRGCQETQKELRRALTEEHRVAGRQHRLARDRARLLTQLTRLKARGDELQNDLANTSPAQARRKRPGAAVR